MFPGASDTTLIKQTMVEVIVSQQEFCDAPRKKQEEPDDDRDFPESLEEVTGVEVPF